MTNQLEKIEPHAKRLEDAADRMDAAGIGGHPTRGHVVTLRDMASSMRADAAMGRMPNEYGGFLHAAADAAAPKGRPILTLVQAAAAKQENVALVAQIAATAQRLNLTCIDPDQRIDTNKLNRELAGRSTDERMAFKAMLARLHVIA